LFSSQIKTFRQRLGISQSELARRAGYSHEFISQIERGLKSPSIKALRKIAVSLGVAPSMLMETRSLPDYPAEEKLRHEVRLLIDELPADKLKIIFDLLNAFSEQNGTPYSGS